MKKLLAFDSDDTIVLSKMPASERMASLLAKALNHFDICIISGTGFDETIYPNTVSQIEKVDGVDLSKLHIMPTCGTRYYRNQDGQWRLQYQEDLTEEQKKKIFEAIESSAKKLGMWVDNPAGEIIEDRLSQVTYSALGQQAKPEDKYAWAEKYKQERKLLNDAVKRLIPEFEVRTAGTTSLDVTKPGIDKAYGMNKLIEATGFTKEDILFFGDKLEEGGNDFPVKNMGIDCVAVERWEDTAYALEGILGVLKA
ncbi:HAD family hydrolase [Candidatus Saccharibacteria bacterium]|nr:MAG: HAD family hydrolase [Candidatus Saccharibacteria bacterium]